MADVYITKPATGGTVAVPEEEVEGRLRRGWQEATPEEITTRKREEEYGGAAGIAEAALVGAARGLTFGGFDVLAEKLPGGERNIRDLQALKEINPTATAAGELAGSALQTSFIPLPGTGVTGAVVRGATEGALFSGQQTITDSVLQDKELTAEALVANMGHGMLVGGVLGGAISGTGRAARVGMQRLKAAVASGEGSFGQGMTKLWAATSKAAGVAGTETIEKLSPLTKEGRAAWRYVDDADRIVAENTERLVSGLKKAHSAIEIGGERFTGSMKRSQIERTVSRDAVEAARQQSQHVLGAVRSELDEMITKGTGEFGQPSKLKQLAKRVDAVAQRVEKGDIVDFNFHLDQLKRDIGAAAQGRRVGGVIGATKDRLRGMYENLRTHLEDEALFGQAGVIQKELNAPWSSTIQAAKRGKLQRGIITEVPTEWGETARQVDERSIREIFANPSSPRAKEATEAIREWLSHGDPFVEASKKNLRLGAGARRRLADYRGAVRDVMKSIDELGKVATGAEYMSKLSGQNAVSAGTLGYVAGSLGPAGIPLAMAAQVVANPKAVLRQGHAIVRMAGNTTNAVQRGVRAVVRGARVPTAATWGYLDAEQRRSFERNVKGVLTSSAQQAAEQARLRLAELGEASPDVNDAAAELAARGQGYLKEFAPMMRRRMTAVGVVGVPPSDWDLERFERRRRVVDKPLSVIETARKGGLITPEAMHALNTVYPSLLGWMRQELVNEIRSSIDKGEALPYDRARAASIILGAPVDVLDAPETVAAIQATYIESEPQPPPQRSSGGEEHDMSDRIRGDLDLETIE